jgi:hypothetical protein
VVHAVRDVQDLEGDDEHHRRAQRLMTLPLGGRERQREERPQHEPRPRLAEELEVERADTRVEVHPHEEVAHGAAAGAGVHRGASVCPQRRGEDEDEHVCRREQRTELLVGNAGRNHARHHGPDGDSECHAEGGPAVEPVGEPRAVGQRRTVADGAGQGEGERDLQEPPGAVEEHREERGAGQVANHGAHHRGGRRHDGSAIVERQADPQPVHERRQRRHQEQRTGGACEAGVHRACAMSIRRPCTGPPLPSWPWRR